MKVKIFISEHRMIQKLITTVHWPRALATIMAAIAVLGFCAVVGRLQLAFGSGPTTFYCMLCGGTRAVHAFWDGRFLEAFNYNPLLFLSAPLVAYFLVGVAAMWVTDYYLPGFRNPFTWLRNWMIGFGAVAVAFMVLRNIPTWPWTLLAP